LIEEGEMPTDARLVASRSCFPRNEGEERRLMEKSGAKEEKLSELEEI
jgi:hypothetical protein